MGIELLTSQERLDVVCQGSHAQMGVEQGRCLRQKILGARAALEHLESFRLQQPWWLPFRAFRRLSEAKAERLLAAPLRQRFPDSYTRLHGIAEGAGVRVAIVYLLNAIEALLSAVRGHMVVPPPGACSTVAVRGERSVTGEPIIAKNFDYLPLVQPFYMLRESRPDSAFRSLEFTVAPLVGTIDGINERGLCVCNNYAFTMDVAEPAATISMLLAEALERCATVNEAAEWISQRPRWGAGLIMLADASGDLASMEISNTRCRLRRPLDGENLIFHTNAFSCAEMVEVQVPRDAVFTEQAPNSLRGTRLHQSAERRDARLSELLGASAGPFGADELASIMADHGPEGHSDDDTICQHSDYWNTTATLQLFPRRRSMRVDFASACIANLHEIKLEA